MSITLKPWNVLVLVGLIGTLLGLSLGQLTLAQSNPTNNALNSIKNTNARILGQLRGLNGRVSFTNENLVEMNDYLFEIEGDTDSVNEDVSDIWSDTGAMRTDLDSIKSGVDAIEIDAERIKTEIIDVAGDTMWLDNIKDRLDDIDSNTFGTCLYVSDDGGTYC